MAKISESLRAAITKCGKTRYQISMDTGINESTLSRFMTGGSLNTKNADILADYLGFDLVKRTKRTRSKGGKK